MMNAPPPDTAGIEVSVVIPTRDRWDLLAGAIRSVMQQRDVSLEVLVVDDGSRSADGRERLPRADGRVRVLRHERSRGVAGARNAGIAAARGRWVAFLDDDDLWAPGKLRTQLDAAGSGDAAFAYASALLVRQDSGAVVRVDAPPPERLSELLAAYNAIPAGSSNVLVTAELIRAVGGFDSRFHHLADWDLWIRLAAAGRAAACQEELVGYRLHAGSMRSTAGGVLRELRRLDREHRRGRPPPERIWLYRWLAEGQLLAGRRLAAGITYVRGAARCRSRADLARAGRTLLGRRRPPAAPATTTPAAADRRWLEDALRIESATAAEVGQTRPTLLGRIRDRTRLARALALERRLRWTSLKAGLAIVYHELTTDPRPDESEIVPAIELDGFRSQLIHLRSHYRLVTAGELADAVRARRRGERFPVAITFDDDLPSHHDLALPALRAAGAPATFFLTGASLSGPSSFWWERLQRAVDGGLPLDGERSSPRDLEEEVAALPPERREQYSRALLERLGGEVPGSGLRAQQVGSLARAGLEIGFHTRLHDPLPELDDAELERALRLGREQLETAAGTPLRTIAYPHGRADARVAGAARRAGFASGFTTEGTAIRARSDALLMGRLYPARASVGRFASQAALTLRRAQEARPGGPAPPRAGRVRRLGATVRGRLSTRLRRRAPAPGAVRFGDLRRLTPISRQYGFDRGLPIDRHYIEDFLRRHGGSPGYAGGDIRGNVLEVGGDEYARRFGGWGGAADGRVAAVDVLHADASNPRATIVGDLATGAGVPDARYDCVICTQTLHVVFEVEQAIATIERMLRPDGVALVTLPGITQTCRPDRDLWGDWWRFTSLSARRLFETAFPAGRIRVEAYGNVLAAVGFLHGLASDDLRRAELDLRDPDYELVIAVRAQKRGPG